MFRFLIIVAGISAVLSATAQTTVSKAGTAAAEATPGASAHPAMHFRDISESAGLTTMPHSTTKRRYVVDTMTGGGVAFLDCNNDGRLDVAVVNDSSIEQYLKGGDLMITLYRQDSKSTTTHFTDITKTAGLTTKGWATGLAVADFDNDGLPDIYVTGYGHNVLYRNVGGCKFEDVTEKAGLKGGGFSTGAAWADYDRDGKVDLFVARYVSTDVHHLPDPDTFSYKGVLVELPDGMQGETDFLFRNRGDGTFENVSEKAGVSDPNKLHGMGVAWGDYDGDGWPDLYVTNDSGWNFLYHNKRNGTFEEIGVLSGSGTGAGGQPYGNMAADFGDFDRDGKLDIFVTRFGNQPASLYWNQGEDQFTDIADRSGLGSPTFVPVKWGTGFGDFDNDGWPDILMVNGNFSSLMDSLPYDAKFAEPIQLFRNKADKTFQEVSKTSGLNDRPLQSRRGTAFGDVNNDGKVDVLVFNVDGPPSLFLNDSEDANHRVLFKLIGAKSNHAAIGARVTVTTPTMSQVDEVHGGGSYLSSSDVRLHFGIGSNTKMNVEVRWPSGLKQGFKDVDADAIYEIREGEAIKKTATLSAPATKAH
jgi:enediyne biosynthesis protein E4